MLPRLNPNAQSNGMGDLKAMYLKHQKEKKRAYERRVLEIELASFTPLVFSVSGGMANECGMFYKRLASLIST